MSARGEPAASGSLRPPPARFRRATCIVLLICVAPAAVGTAEAALSPRTAEAPSAGIDAVFGEAAGAYGLAPEDALGALGDELPDISGEEGLLCDADLRVAGFERCGSVDDVMAHLGRRFEEKGWSKVESGVSSCATFAKGSGALRWAFASFTQIDGSVSVVMQWRGDEMEEVDDGWF